MAETVHFFLERMVPELQDLEEHGIFNKVCSESANAWLV